MGNQELLAQVTELFSQQTEVISDMFSKINGRIDKLENEVKQVRLEQEINVAKRIDALFDGYGLTYEKQGEQGEKIEVLEDKTENLDLRITSVENKIA